MSNDLLKNYKSVLEIHSENGPTHNNQEAFTEYVKSDPTGFAVASAAAENR